MSTGDAVDHPALGFAINEETVEVIPSPSLK
jgi:hypothetical protein